MPKKHQFYPELLQGIEKLFATGIPTDRKEVLDSLVHYIQGKRAVGQPVKLNFICTHNSRRSQFAQIWAYAAANYYAIPIKSFSGGVEVTAFNERAVKAVERMGFRVKSSGGDNPTFEVLVADDLSPLHCFSKLFDDPINPNDEFAAVMTCSHADENCPFIPGTEARISINYEDPKDFDNSPEEARKYQERCEQIGREMLYVFASC